MTTRPVDPTHQVAGPRARQTDGGNPPPTRRAGASALLTLIAAVLLATACARPELANQPVPAPDAEFARTAAELLRSRRLGELEGALDESWVNGRSQADLAQLASLFPDSEPIDMSVVAASPRVVSGDACVEMTLEYRYPDLWVLTRVLVRRSGDKLSIAGLYAQTLPESVETFTRFDVGRQGVLGYLFAALAILVPLFTLCVFVICLRTPIPRRKWLWAVFVLVGFSPVSLNLTSGEVGFKPLSMMLLGAAAVSMGPYAPWVISFAAPFGAIAFLARRGTWLKVAATNPAADGRNAPGTGGADPPP